MASFNSITVVGNLGRDPETKTTDDGLTITSFSVATSKKQKNKDEVTTWFRVTLFGKNADNAGKYLSKGSKVAVVGELSARQYTTKAGAQGTSLEIAANSVTFLDPKGESNAMGASAGGGGPIVDDDIPF